MVRFLGLALAFLLLFPAAVALAVPDSPSDVSADADADEQLDDSLSDENQQDFLSSLLDALSELGREEEEPDSAADSNYMPPDEFFAVYGDDYSIETYTLQTTPTSPVTAANANGFKKVILSLFGDYSPVITQYRYQSNTSSNYTYVNDIQLDYPWLTSAVIFAIVLYCCIRLGAAMLCHK